MAIAAFLTPGARVLTTIGDVDPNTITLSRNAAGQILVNGGAVAVLGGTPTVANTGLMQVFGLGGNDIVTLDETNGALPAANLFGGTGSDVLTGGSAGDLLFGQNESDTLQGRGGNDQLFGGAQDDVLVGGDADDLMFGEGGNDRLIWNPGDDTDLFEGGAGTDTAEVNGGNGREVFTATANGTRVRFDRVDPAPFAIDMGGIENLVLNMNGGDDSFSATGNLAALIRITVDGGTGDDTILGSNGVDTLLGGDGDDFVDGQQGNDVGLLGAGEDVFQWDPGDGSDVVEGQAGFDTMLFNGSAGSEIFEASANGGRVRFTRNLANIVMDLNDVEQVTVNALGGTDTITVRDTSGTDLQQVNVNLSGTIGGVAADGQADTVIVDATNGDDVVTVLGTAGDLLVSGLNAAVFVADAEAARDSLVINALGGDDRISAASVAAGNVRLTIDGGAGDDEIAGSGAADVLLGGDGDDFVDGNQGDDLMLLGAGNDIATWDPGEGSDTIEGGTGQDVLLFRGSGAAEAMDISANGGRVRLFRDVGSILMDLDDVETIDIDAQLGADSIVVGDLSGTDVTAVAIRLGAVLGSPATDGASDQVTVFGNAGNDTIDVDGIAGSATALVGGLTARVTMTRAEAALDRLTVNGGAGNDVIDASGLDDRVIGLTLLGGLGVDTMVGSDGDDVILGGDGDDVALMGAGDDVFVWNPGDDNDTLEGQAGSDTMDFNGANVGETIDLFANGGRVQLFRNIANVTMDLNDVETVDFAALGGADTITVGDLSGTDVSTVRLDLSADGQSDTIVINATNGDDVIVVAGDAGGITVVGLTAVVEIVNFESGDRLVVNALGGDDILDATGFGFAINGDGGAGDDVLLGGAGNDVLAGGLGDDVLIGGLGVNALDGGPGDNILL